MALRRGRPAVAKRARKATRAAAHLYDRFIVPGAPEGRRLATHYFAKSAAPSILTVDEVPPELYRSHRRGPSPVSARARVLRAHHVCGGGVRR